MTILLLVVALWIDGQPEAVGADLPLEQQAPILLRMKANDQAFDRVALEYLRRTVRENSPPKMFMPYGLTPEQVRNRRTLPHEKESVFCTRETLSVWSREACFLRTADLNAREGKQEAGLFQKWGNVGGQVQEMFDVPTPDSPMNGRFVERRTTPAALGRLQEQRMEVEMALGIGFFSRIRKIEDVLKNTDGTWTINAEFCLWTDDRGVGSLTVTDDGIVRRAEIRSHSNGCEFQVIVSTEGYAKTNLLTLAQNGRYRCVWLSKQTKDQNVPMNKRRADHQLTFLDLRKYPDRKQFEAAAAIDPPTGTYIADLDAMEKRVTKPDGTEEVLRKISPLQKIANNTHSVLLLIVCGHALLFLGGAGWYLWRRQKTQAAKLETP